MPVTCFQQAPIILIAYAKNEELLRQSTIKNWSESVSYFKAGAATSASILEQS